MDGRFWRTGFCTNARTVINPYFTATLLLDLVATDPRYFDLLITTRIACLG